MVRRAGNLRTGERLAVALAIAKLLLARSYLAAGRPEEAVELLRAEAERHGDARTLNELGAALLAARRPEEAVVALQRARRHAAEEPAVLANLGNALRQAGDIEAAERWLRRALELDPDLGPAWHDLGLLFRESDSPQAERCFREAMHRMPDHPAVLRDLGTLLAVTGDPRGAVDLLRESVRLMPDDASARGCLAGAWAKLDRPFESLREAEIAAALAPGEAAHQADLAAARLEINDWRGAIAAADRAIALAPQDGGVRFTRSLARLMGGDYTAGFAEFESRWLTDGLRPHLRHFDRPEWDGADPAGRTLFIAMEQGFGDQIMFARFIPLLAARGARVLVEAAPSLHRLLASLDGVAGLIPFGGRPAAYDGHLHLMSLPHRLGLTLEEIPSAPYLGAPAEGRPALPEPRPGRPLKIGICWGSKPRPRNRTCPVEHFAALAAGRPVTFYSLVKGELEAELAKFPEEVRPFDLGPMLTDFSDTAACMRQLDLVITADTAVPHLAGALGRPVWLALRHGADWRWLTGRADSPWYPTARLFRQGAPGDWSSVFAPLADALDAWIAARGDAFRPASVSV